MKPLQLLATTVVFGLCLVACTATPENSLVGRIWLPQEKRFISRPDLLESMAGARFILLGEIHDHPVHHRIRAKLLEELADTGLTPVVAMEMISTEQRAALERYRQHEDPDPAALGKALAWEERGWPDWGMYRPIAEVVFARKLPLADANLPRSEIRELVRAGGLASLDEQRLRRLNLDQPLPEDQDQRLVARLQASHCHDARDALIDAMRDGQRLRDAYMARRLIELAQPERVAVLLAGNGHVHIGHGVPHYLREAHAGPVFSLGLIPVREGDNRPGDYLHQQGKSMPYDAVLFTSPHPQPPPDPCEKIRERTG